MHPFTQYIKLTHPNPDIFFGKQVHEAWDEICTRHDGFMSIFIRAIEDFVQSQENNITEFQRKNPDTELPEHLAKLANKCHHHRQLIRMMKKIAKSQSRKNEKYQNIIDVPDGFKS